MNWLSLEDTWDGLARASEVRWCGNVLKGDDNDVSRKALDSEVMGRRGRR